MKKFQINVMGKSVMVEKGTAFEELGKRFQDQCQDTILVAKQGNQLRELRSEILTDEPIVFFDLTQE
ncbi:MAG: hypothetical protein PHG19_11075, partial [Anaerotignum sp.]|nr:hypothetical protein [Anaerotignum sp.]